MPLYGQSDTQLRRAEPHAHSQWRVQTRTALETAIRSVGARQPMAMRYGLAFALVLIALGLTYLFQEHITTTRFIFFSGAVVLAALNGGFGPGVAATVLSTGLQEYFLTQPQLAIFARPNAIIQTVVFILVVGLVSAFQEARLRAQQQLVRTTKELNVILQHVGAGITAQRASDHRMVFANDTAAQQSGFASPDEFLQTPPEKLVTLFELYDELGRRIDFGKLPGRRAVNERARAGEITYRMRRSDTGLERWMHLKSVPIYDEKNEPTLVVSIMQDITDQKRLEALRHQEEQRLRAVLDNVGILTGLLTPDGIVIEANHTALELGGLKAEDVVGKPLEETYWWSYAEQVQTQLRDAIERARNGEVAAYDVQLRTGEDKRTTFAFQLAPIYEEGRLKFLLPSAVDITQRQQYEQELQQVNSMLHWHQQRLNRIVNNIPGIIWEALIEPENGGQQMTFASDQVEKMLGFTANDVYTNQGFWQSVVHPADLQQTVESLRSSLDREGSASIEFRMISRDGRVIPVETHTTIVPAEDGKSAFAVGVIMDVTSRKAAEERAAEYAADLQRSNDELHQFAYVASHDLQEPLRMVSSYLQLLEKHYGDRLDGDAKEYIGFAIDGAVRMKALIMDLLAYSRVESQTRSMKRVQSQRALDQALSNLQVTISERNATITADSLPAVWGDEMQLTQLFQNLVGNAIKFSDDKPPQVHVSVKRQDGEWLFSVEDNGIGIEAQYKDRIFAIFQRLHSKGKYPGTGIGLAICRKIVERHAGRIWVESVPNEGSTFYFTIPADSRKRSYVQRHTH